MPRSADDLATRRRVHRHWAEGSFGLMGRTPDHVASLITGFAGMRDVFDRGRRAVRRQRRRLLPARARGRLVHRVRDHARPRSIGPSRPTSSPSRSSIRASSRSATTASSSAGAQMIGTSAAIADWLFLSSIVPLQPGDEDYAISVVMPLNATGLRVYPRRPYATSGDERRSTTRSRRASTSPTASSCSTTSSSRGSTSSSTATSASSAPSSTRPAPTCWPTTRRSCGSS